MANSDFDFAKFDLAAFDLANFDLAAFDLVPKRTAGVPPSFVWDARIRPDLLKRRFCPTP